MLQLAGAPRSVLHPTPAPDGCDCMQKGVLVAMVIRAVAVVVMVVVPIVDMVGLYDIVGVFGMSSPGLFGSLYLP